MASSGRRRVSQLAVVVIVLLAQLAHGLETSSSVSILTRHNFSRPAGPSADAWFIMFYAPWCGHLISRYGNVLLGVRQTF